MYTLQFPHRLHDTLAIKLGKRCPWARPEFSVNYYHVPGKSIQLPVPVCCTSPKQRNNLCLKDATFWEQRLFALRTPSQNKGEQCVGAEVTAEKIRTDCCLMELRMCMLTESTLQWWICVYHGGKKKTTTLHTLLLVRMFLLTLQKTAYNHGFQCWAAGL